MTYYIILRPRASLYIVAQLYGYILIIKNSIASTVRVPHTIIKIKCDLFANIDN